MRMSGYPAHAGLAAGLFLSSIAASAAPAAAQTGPARTRMTVSAVVEPACSVSSAPAAGAQDSLRVSCSSGGTWTASTGTSAPTLDSSTSPETSKRSNSGSEPTFITVTY